MDLTTLWPPGGDDPLLSALAEAHILPDGTLDFPAVLRDDRLGRIALVSSFGAEAAVLLHMVSVIAPDTPVLFLDTDKHFPETLAYRDALVERFGLTDLSSIRPNPKMLAEDDPDGALHRTNPDMCCMLRKTFPLQDALAEFDSWITGRKRFHGHGRSMLSPFERDGRHVKINPLFRHDARALADYFIRHDIPRHPLQERGYLSIGCAPCTQPVGDGADIRAGRWLGTDKTECGIHLGPDGRFARGTPKPD